jgi:hypothetical protein
VKPVSSRRLFASRPRAVLVSPLRRLREHGRHRWGESGVSVCDVKEADGPPRPPAGKPPRKCRACRRPGRREDNVAAVLQLRVDGAGNAAWGRTSPPKLRRRFGHRAPACRRRGRREDNVAAVLQLRVDGAGNAAWGRTSPPKLHHRFGHRAPARGPPKASRRRIFRGLTPEPAGRACGEGNAVGGPTARAGVPASC